MGVYNHTGQVVTDLERAKRFYQEMLGFKFWYEIAPPDEATSKLNCLEPTLGVTASYLTLDRFVLEVSGGNIVVDTGNLVLGPPIGTNTIDQSPEGPLCV